MNVLDLPGPAFLRLYLALLVTAVAAALLLRWWLRGPGGDGLPGRRPQDLHPLEVAYLAGGPRAAMYAAIADLVHRGHIHVVKNSGRLRAGANAPPAGALPLERAVYDAVAAQRPGGIAGIRRAADASLVNLAARLESLGLALGGSRSALIRAMPTALLAALFALGVTKIVVGIDRGRPVGFLVFLCLVTAGAAVVFAVSRPTFRTRRGEAILARLKRENDALRLAAYRTPRSLVGNDLSMTLALFGVGAFAAGPMGDVNDAIRERETRRPDAATNGGSCGGGDTSTSASTTSSSANDGGSSGGGDGGGGSSCGGGGGGGGCGGCGGGGG